MKRFRDSSNKPRYGMGSWLSDDDQWIFKKHFHNGYSGKYRGWEIVPYPTRLAPPQESEAHLFLETMPVIFPSLKEAEDAVNVASSYRKGHRRECIHLSGCGCFVIYKNQRHSWNIIENIDSPRESQILYAEKLLTRNQHFLAGFASRESAFRQLNIAIKKQRGNNPQLFPYGEA